MRFLQLSVFVILVSLLSASASPSLCRNPRIRKEWRTLTNTEKQAYIEAEKCVQSHPPTGLFPAAKTAFDDFHALHVNLSDEIHWLAQFLPWHRRFLVIKEDFMRTNCGFEGSIPFWDWSRDIVAKNTTRFSPIYDPRYGFGSQGVDIPGYNGILNNMTQFVHGWVLGGGGGCIPDGPFAKYNLSIGPGTSDTNHCLTRAWSDSFNDFFTPEYLSNILNDTSYETLHGDIEGIEGVFVGPHGAGHFSVGGEMGNFYSSPGDPIFYLHHSMIDRLWWTWQKKDLATRLTDMTGVATINPPYVNITLDFELKMQGLAPLKTVREVMDIRSTDLCYDYDY